MSRPQATTNSYREENQDYIFEQMKAWKEKAEMYEKIITLLCLEMTSKKEKKTNSTPPRS